MVTKEFDFNQMIYECEVHKMNLADVGIHLINNYRQMAGLKVVTQQEYQRLKKVENPT